MSKKFVFLLPLLSAAPLFLAGALRLPVAEPPASFVPRAVSLAPEFASVDAKALLERAVDRLSPERIRWLHVHLRQQMGTSAAAFESEGTLQLGPDHCVRLDLTVRTGVIPARRLVVSDGRAVAEVTQLGFGPPRATTRLLGPVSAPSTQSPEPPAEALCQLGCGGPYPLLKDLQTRLRALAAETGVWQRSSVVRLRGVLAAGPTGVATSPVAADFCYLYLDAQSLWPHRLEWWGTGSKQLARPVLALEFTDPQVNRPLSLDECVRVFSYQPE